MKYICVDPGSTTSGFVEVETVEDGREVLFESPEGLCQLRLPVRFLQVRNDIPNNELFKVVSEAPPENSTLLIEYMQNYGRIVGKTVFETQFFAGALAGAHSGQTLFSMRSTVSSVLKAKGDDPVFRSAVKHLVGERMYELILAKFRTDGKPEGMSSKSIPARFSEGSFERGFLAYNSKGDVIPGVMSAFNLAGSSSRSANGKCWADHAGQALALYVAYSLSPDSFREPVFLRSTQEPRHQLSDIKLDPLGFDLDCF
jgi:hypothetical protein